MRTSKPRYTVVIVDGDSFVLDGETGEYVAHFGRKEEGARDWADNMSRIDAAKRSGARLVRDSCLLLLVVLVAFAIVFWTLSR
jgi:hypothetical protein